jgi:hypothetical protein
VKFTPTKIGLGLLIFSLWFWVPVIQTGCTTTQQQIQYRTLKAVAITVDAALKAYADAVVAGKVDIETQHKVMDMKARYADSMTSAVAAAKATTEPAPVNVQALADALVTILQAATRPGGVK